LVSAYAGQRLFASKWVIAVIVLLGTRPRRHSEILQALGGQISSKVLTRTLTWMATEQLVTQPGRSRTDPYALTRRGRSLYDLVKIIAAWADADALQHGQEAAAET